MAEHEKAAESVTAYFGAYSTVNLSDILKQYLGYSEAIRSAELFQFEHRIGWGCDVRLHSGQRHLFEIKYPRDVDMRGFVTGIFEYLEALELSSRGIVWG